MRDWCRGVLDWVNQLKDKSAPQTCTWLVGVDTQDQKSFEDTVVNAIGVLTRYRFVSSRDGSRASMYSCSQKQKKRRRGPRRGKRRNTNPSAKAKCDGRLGFFYYGAMVFVTMHHGEEHAGRDDCSDVVAPEVEAVIASLALELSPSQIRSKLVKMRVSPMPSPHQICYRVRRAIHLQFQSSVNPYDSAVRLVENHDTIVGGALRPTGVDTNVQAGFIVMAELLLKFEAVSGGTAGLHVAREIVVDATHKTNGTTRGARSGSNPQFELYCLLITFRGEGYPLSYMYLQEEGAYHIFHATL